MVPDCNRKRALTRTQPRPAPWSQVFRLLRDKRSSSIVYKPPSLRSFVTSAQTKTSAKSLLPTRCPAIQFNPDTIYLELASDPTSLSPQTPVASSPPFLMACVSHFSHVRLVTGVGCCFLLQGIFLTQESNSSLMSPPFLMVWLQIEGSHKFPLRSDNLIEQPTELRKSLYLPLLIYDKGHKVRESQMEEMVCVHACVCMCVCTRKLPCPLQGSHPPGTLSLSTQKLPRPCHLEDFNRGVTIWAWSMINSTSCLSKGFPSAPS